MLFPPISAVNKYVERLKCGTETNTKRDAHVTHRDGLDFQNKTSQQRSRPLSSRSLMLRRVGIKTGQYCVPWLRGIIARLKASGSGCQATVVTTAFVGIPGKSKQVRFFISRSAIFNPPEVVLQSTRRLSPVRLKPPGGRRGQMSPKRRGAKTDEAEEGVATFN